MALSSMLKLVPVLLATYILRPADRQGGIGTFATPGNVSYKLPLACSKVLVAWAIDDVQGTDARIIGWFTSKTDGNSITFSCAGQASQFVYAAICL